VLIKSIAASLGSRRVSNNEVLEIIKERSTNYEGNLNTAIRFISSLLHKSGLVERRWCDKNETPMDHLAIVTKKILSESNLKPNEIDLLIYVGIGRGFLEPGNSHMVAKAFGFNAAQCFDVVDACMSWIRALHIVDNMFKSGVYRNAVVINAEFNMLENGPLFPKNFSLSNKQQIYYTFPSFSIGEAATATLLSPEEPDNFDFHFLTKPIFSDLCTVPLVGFKKYCEPNDFIGANGPGQFTSFGIELHKAGWDPSIEIYKRMIAKNPEPKQIFVHASSKKEWNDVGKVIGINEKIHHIYPETGNLVSASVPTAIVNAVDNNIIQKGDQIALWIGSAGLSVNATNLVF
jgi:acyl-CoA:acyl-CoA alkyltransferase